MSTDFKDVEAKMSKCVDATRAEFSSIRTGRATPALLDRLHVEAYGNSVPLKQVAGVSVPDSRTLVISAYDKGVVPDIRKAIERAINDSKVGLTPHSDGKQLRLLLPPMSQETRLKMAAQVKGYAETAKVSLRNARRDANKLVETEQKGGVLTEDEAEKGKEDVQELTKRYEATVDDLVEKKRKEVMEV